MVDESFKDFILDQLQDIPDVWARKMFGGFGLYAGKTFFGIISDDVLYFKTNEKSRELYIEKGMKPFAPSEKQVLKNYYEVPIDLLENPVELALLAQTAVGLI